MTDAEMKMKHLFIKCFKTAGVSRKDLADRLGVRIKTVDHLLDAQKRSMAYNVSEALNKLGYEFTVDIRKMK